MIPQSIYEIRRAAAWPDQPGTVLVPFPSTSVSEPEKTPAPEPEVNWDARLRQGMDS
jgi:hypothetical protein